MVGRSHTGRAVTKMPDHITEARVRAAREQARQHELRTGHAVSWFTVPEWYWTCAYWNDDDRVCTARARIEEESHDGEADQDSGDGVTGSCGSHSPAGVPGMTQPGERDKVRAGGAHRAPRPEHEYGLGDALTLLLWAAILAGVFIIFGMR